MIDLDQSESLLERTLARIGWTFDGLNQAGHWKQCDKNSCHWMPKRVLEKHTPVCALRQQGYSHAEIIRSMIVLRLVSKLWPRSEIPNVGGKVTAVFTLHVVPIPRFYVKLYSSKQNFFSRLLSRPTPRGASTQFAWLKKFPLDIFASEIPLVHTTLLTHFFRFLCCSAMVTARSEDSHPVKYRITTDNQSEPVESRVCESHNSRAPSSRRYSPHPRESGHHHRRSPTPRSESRDSTTHERSHKDRHKHKHRHKHKRTEHEHRRKRRSS
ncbi:hypothetical protein D915_005186 [Fasciola hepatica]|uniref:Uncharacterized protein n=1 Tax=Fasciola hepatica TaxID=6192 RepID=A0A4E0RSL7_FASHE|nr:hypothetical protein D915_005186 [Fasciola hepatica]